MKPSAYANFSATVAAENNSLVGSCAIRQPFVQGSSWLERGRWMLTPIARATAYLEKLEADRQAAIEMSEHKAEEAKLIAARQEGFRAAMEILAGAISADNCESQSDKSGPRRQRRNIKLLILRELSFSGEAMTTTQIAKAIGYIPERTETVLKRLEIGGELRRDEKSGRWALVITGRDQLNEHPAGAQEFSSTTAAAA